MSMFTNVTSVNLQLLILYFDRGNLAKWKALADKQRQIDESETKKSKTKKEEAAS